LIDVYKNQVHVLATLSQRTADVGLNFLLQHEFKSLLIYNYSKSIAIAVKQLATIMGNNLEVYISSGLTGEGYISLTM
jgi:membrane-bound lytic murein transglycosylase B